MNKNQVAAYSTQDSEATTNNEVFNAVAIIVFTYILLRGTITVPVTAFDTAS